jgi:CBS domain-containing protein
MELAADHSLANHPGDPAEQGVAPLVHARLFPRLAARETRFCRAGRREPPEQANEEVRMASTATTVREAMTASPRAVQVSTSAVEAAQLMASENVGSLPVVEGNRLVGMVTDRDLVLQVLAKERTASTTTVGEICSRDPVTVRADEPLDDALGRMAKQRVRRVPVVDGEELVGIVSQADVARVADAQATGQLVEEISQK